MLLTLHNILEFSTIILGAITLFISWHSCIEDSTVKYCYKLKIVSFIILCTSALDLLHLLSYPTNTLICDNNYIIYWILSRLLFSCALIYSITIPISTPKYSDTILLYIASLLIISAITGLLTNFNFTFDNFNSLPYLIYIDSYSHPLVFYILGTTMLLDTISLIILRRYYNNYVNGTTLHFAIFFNISTNVCYTLAPYFNNDFLAHIFKLITYYFILRSFFALVIKYPYSQLFKLKEQLEKLVSNNASLYKESEKQRNLVEETLAKIGTIISSQLNVKDTLEAIADMVADLMNTKQSLISLLCNNQTQLQVAATCGINTPPTFISIANSLAKQVIEQNKALIISDLSLQTDIFRPQLIFSSIHSIICAPLVNDSQIIGFIEAYSTEKNAFSERDSLFLTALGRHAGTAIASAMLYEETKLHLEEEKFLSKITKAASASIDTETILEQCTLHTAKALNADIALGLITTNDKASFSTLTTMNFDFKLDTIKLSQYPDLANLVARFKPFIASADIFPPFIDLYDQNPTKHIMVLPITVEEKLYGLIILGWQRFVSQQRLCRLTFASLVVQQIALGIEKAQLYNQVKSMALSDSLTGLANRRNFDLFLNTELKRSASLKRPLTLVMLDLDKFKNYNDTYGHLIGDKLLMQIGQILQHNVRNIDLPARYGGEEFSIILPECDSKEGIKIAEKIRLAIEKSSFPDNQGTLTARITASLGLATYDPNLIPYPPDIEKIIAIADKALYQAKEQGRNLVINKVILE